MNKHGALPAVLLWLAASGAFSVSTSAAANIGQTSEGAKAASALPIAAMFRATAERREPERLRAWAGKLSLWDEYPLPRCGTITGSGNDWDDSAQDCDE